MIPNPGRLAQQLARFARSRTGRAFDAAHAVGQGIDYTMAMLHPERAIALRRLNRRSPDFEHALEVHPGQGTSGDIVTDLDPHTVRIPSRGEGELHHTHPGGFAPLSIPDLLAAYERGLTSATKNADAAGVFAHQTMGGGSVARWSDNALRMNVARMGRALDSANMRIRAAMRARTDIPDIKIPLSAASPFQARGADINVQIANLALMRAMRRYGFLDRFGFATFSRRQQRLLRRFERQIEELSRLADRPMRAVHRDLYGLRYPFTPTNLAIAGGGVAGIGAALGEKHRQRRRRPRKTAQ